MIDAEGGLWYDSRRNESGRKLTEREWTFGAHANFLVSSPFSMKRSLLEQSQVRGKPPIARGIHTAPAHTGRIALCLFWLCVGGLALTCGLQPYDAQPPSSLLNTVEPPSPRKPDPPLSQSGPSPDRASSGSSLSVESLNEEELEVARQLIRDYPNDSTPLGFLGNVYSKHGLNKEATRYWEASLRIEPNRADMYDAMASVALQRQEYDRALELARKAVSLNPSLPSSRRHVAESLMALGRLREALEELHQALKAVPRDVETDYLLGSVLVQLGELNAAKEYYEAALEIDPHHAQACYQLFVVNTRLNLTEQANVYRERFVRLRSENRDASQKWVDDYDDLRLVRQQVAATCDTAARYYRAHQNQARAKKLWLRAAGLDSRYVASLLQLAMLYGQADQTEEALDLCNQAEAIAPRDPIVQLNVGILAAKLRRFSVAEAALRRACALAPENASAARLLCQVLLESNGNAAEAAALARKAVDREPSAENYYVLGAAEAHRGHGAAAAAALRRAADLAPTEQKYREGLEQLKTSR
jgi:tetratricopeptide (TPR) repeat protein